MEEQQILQPPETFSSKFKIFFIILVVLIILVIALIFFIFKQAKGVDLKIEKVVLDKPEGSNFTYPIITIKNIGNKPANSTFLIGVFSADSWGVQWEYYNPINAGQSIDLRGAGFIINPGEKEITFILDSQNQTQDINRKNNIYEYQLNP